MIGNKYSWIFCSALFPTTLFAANSGFYVGAGLGQAVGPETVLIANSDFNHNTFGTITGQPIDTYNFSTRGSTLYHFMAGYNFNRCVGVEASYSYLGRQDLMSLAGGVTKDFGFDGTLDSFYYGITGVGHLPLDKLQGNLFAKAGLVVLHSDAIINDPNGVIYVNPGKYEVKTNNAALLYGVGAEFYFQPQLGIEVEWNRISRFDNSKIGNMSYNQFLVGIIYSLPWC